MSLENIKKNYKKNSKKLNAIIADIITTVVGLVFFGLRVQLDWLIIGIIILYNIKPYLFNYINLVFKGEIGDVEKQLEQERKRNEYLQSIAEHKIKIAAMTGNEEQSIMSNEEWCKTNKKAKEFESQ